MSLSALMIGTCASCASSSIRLCPYTRARITSLYRASTRAVSRAVSFTPSWMSSAPRNNAWPPSRAMPVSVETRVRVLRFWKIIAIVFPTCIARARAPEG